MNSTTQYHIGDYLVSPETFWISIIVGIIIFIWVFKIQKKKNIKNIKTHIQNKGYEIQSVKYYPAGSINYSNIDGTCYEVCYLNKEQKFERKLCFCSINDPLTWIDPQNGI